MVGTIEPRKGHSQSLDAFELLWSKGAPQRLVIVGKPGWMTEAPDCADSQPSRAGQTPALV